MFIEYAKKKHLPTEGERAERKDRLRDKAQTERRRLGAVLDNAGLNNQVFWVRGQIQATEVRKLQGGRKA